MPVHEPTAAGAPAPADAIANAAAEAVQPLPVPPALLGESPFWHPHEQRLYWVDIAGRRLHRFDPARAAHDAWALDAEPGCCAPLRGGGVLLALRDGLWRLDPDSGARSLVAPPPYDPACQRFNDGKADAQGRLWVGTLDDRRAPEAALYCFSHGRFERVAGGVAVSNGLGFSPDGTRLYWADTRAHLVSVLPLDPVRGTVGAPQVLHRFAPRAADQALDRYGGRPDGAAVDREGAYWVAMYEGQRLVRLAPDGALLQELALPVRCPTMPCFGDADLRTLYITSARDKRPSDELARQPWAGGVLRVRVAVPGLPVNFAAL